MSIDKGQLKELIVETLNEINMYSESAVNLLMGTAAQESHLGTYIKQIKGPAKGVFQMEPLTCMDIYENYLIYQPQLLHYILENIAIKFSPNELVWNIKFSIIMCRLHYMRVPKKLPGSDNIHEMGCYWKKYYNTNLGKGTIEEFKRNYKRFILI